MSVYKAYDIRGTYPDQIDEARARRIGGALARFLDARRLVVGRDMRTMAPAVTDALCDGIMEQGCEVVDIGVVSTPVIYHAIGTIACDGGVMVTASHNPKEYIGFKMCRSGPAPISGDSGIKDIEALAEGAPAALAPPHGVERGRREPVDVEKSYLDEIVDLVGGPDAIPAQRIVVDYANGAGLCEGPAAFARFPALEVVPLFDVLDGTFPNHEANPLVESNLDALRERVIAEGASLGLAFDGDADRCAFVDRNGRTVGADIVTAILVPALLRRKPGAGVIYDLRSSRIVPETIVANGGRPLRERVGHSFMKETMKREGAIGGGELSGHFYFAEYHNSDNGLLAGLMVLAELGRSGKDLASAAEEKRVYFQSGEINFRVDDKDGALARIAQTFADGEIDRLDGIMVQYPDWWVNVRPSNTEPFLRLVMEAESPELLARKRKVLIDMLGQPATGGH
ncbi:MAG: phosphomannomutase/phosphoglucomutase [Planctomycetes bacterium]|nr:phosphomannomutase/phosphoglucomutase [Planctomycetota bacterium]MCB9917819.1 phosphomannomutase/phosphoglucomutase [Planctomycetota bacterium]